MSKPKKEAGKGVARTEKANVRLWLICPPELFAEPVLWKLGNQFQLRCNLRYAAVQENIGLLALEMDGNRNAVDSAIKRLESLRITVTPIELHVMEG